MGGRSSYVSRGDGRIKNIHKKTYLVARGDLNGRRFVNSRVLTRSCITTDLRNHRAIVLSYIESSGRWSVGMLMGEGVQLSRLKP